MLRQPTQQEASVQPKQELSQIIFRGALTGAIVPVGTVPLDRIATHFQIDDQHKLSSQATWSKIFKQSEKSFSVGQAFKTTWQGYPFVTKTNVMRYGLTYLTSPIIENLARKNGADEQASRIVGNTVAGGLDGLVSGVLSPIRQQYFTHPEKIHEVTDLKSKAVRENLLVKTKRATPYVLARNTLYWPIYNEFVHGVESKMNLADEKNTTAKNSKEFIAGAGAGLATTVLLHPLDSLRTRHVHYSDQSFKELLTSGYKEFGSKTVAQLGYRGLPFALFRAPIAMGLTNFAKHTADVVNEKYKSKKT